MAARRRLMVSLFYIHPKDSRGTRWGAMVIYVGNLASYIAPAMIGSSLVIITRR